MGHPAHGLPHGSCGVHAPVFVKEVVPQFLLPPGAIFLRQVLKFVHFPAELLLLLGR
jgi:hypothetical protein